MSYDTNIGIELITCPACDGQGEHQVADRSFGPNAGPYGDPTPTGVQCEICGGTGKAEIEEVRHDQEPNIDHPR